MAKKLATIEEVTAAAEQIIPHYVTSGDTAVALFVSSSFLEVRLETILRHFFKLRGRGSRELYDNVGLKQLVRLAYAFEVIDKTDHDEFLALADRRNTLGHETEGYREWDEDDARLNKRLSNRALDFIKANGTKKKILARLSATPGVARKDPKQS